MIDYEKYLTASLKEGVNDHPGMIKVTPEKVLRAQIASPARSRAVKAGVDGIIGKQREKIGEELKTRLDKAGFNILKFGEVNIAITCQPTIGIELVNYPRSIRLSVACPNVFPIITPLQFDVRIATGVRDSVSAPPGNSRLDFRFISSAAHGGSRGFAVASHRINCVFYFEKSTVNPNSYNYFSSQVPPTMRITEHELPILGKLGKYVTTKEIEEAQQQMFDLMFNFSHNLSLLESTRRWLDGAIADLKALDDALADAINGEEFDI
jgi:hypothetical protein